MMEGPGQGHASQFLGPRQMKNGISYLHFLLDGAWRDACFCGRIFIERNHFARFSCASLLLSFCAEGFSLWVHRLINLFTAAVVFTTLKNSQIAPPGNTSLSLQPVSPRPSSALPVSAHRSA